MNKKPIPSRNRKRESKYEMFYTCPYCKNKFIIDDLTEDTYRDDGSPNYDGDYYMFLNEKIVHCDCGDFIPFVTYNVEYKYS